jgi:hypothetical protein
VGEFVLGGFSGFGSEPPGPARVKVGPMGRGLFIVPTKYMIENNVNEYMYIYEYISCAYLLLCGGYPYSWWEGGRVIISSMTHMFKSRYI